MVCFSLIAELTKRKRFLFVNQKGEESLGKGYFALDPLALPPQGPRMEKYALPDTTSQLLNEIAELKREMEKRDAYTARLELECAALRNGIDARMKGYNCPDVIWTVSAEYAAKLESLKP